MTAFVVNEPWQNPQLPKPDFAARPAATRAWVRLAYGGLASLALLALFGCRNQPSNPNDPFLPFMKTRVPPPNMGTAPADPYSQNGGAPQVEMPANSSPAPITNPSLDRIGPPGAYGLPQSSIDRSKVIDRKRGEVQTGATSIARRTKSHAGQASVVTSDEQLAASKATTQSKALKPEVSATSEAEAIAFSDTAPAATAQEPRLLEPAENAEGTGEEIADRLQVGQVAKSDNRATLRILPEEAVDTGSGQVAISRTAPDARLSVTASTPDTQVSSHADSQPLVAQATYSAGTTPQHADQVTLAMAAEPSVDSSSSAGDEHSTDVSLASFESSEPAKVATSNNLPSATSDFGSNVPLSASPAVTAASNSSKTFDYDPSYGWLRGRLEYSQAQRQWKLRYIPIDGTTDQYGGSVVLGQNPRLEGFEPGDFAMVQGRVLSSSSSSRGFSPQYEISQIVPAVQ